MTVEQLPYTGCPWPIDSTCIPDDWDALPEPVKALSVALASNSLVALTARRVGGCPITIRPYSGMPDCLPVMAAYGVGVASWAPGISSAGFWVNNCGCGPQSGYSCAIKLPPPVGRVDSVRLNGAEMDMDDFRVDSGNVLVYVGGGDCPFDAPQNLMLDDTQDGTWSVTYLNAIKPDLLAAQAAARLAFEFSLACTGNVKRCRLPENVTTVVRLGVAMELGREMWPSGLTGIREVDAWLRSVNPDGRKQQARIYSPDLEPPPIQGWKPTGIPGGGGTVPIESGGGA